MVLGANDIEIGRTGLIVVYEPMRMKMLFGENGRDNLGKYLEFAKSLLGYSFPISRD